MKFADALKIADGNCQSFQLPFPFDDTIQMKCNNFIKQPTIPPIDCCVSLHLFQIQTLLWSNWRVNTASSKIYLLHHQDQKSLYNGGADGTDITNIGIDWLFMWYTSSALAYGIKSTQWVAISCCHSPCCMFGCIMYNNYHSFTVAWCQHIWISFLVVAYSYPNKSTPEKAP